MQVSKVYNEDGLKFDSKLEKACYDLLVESGLEFVFQYKYILQDKLKYNGEAVRQITLTVDFYLPELNVIIDSKGYQREDNKLKWKLLKAKLADEQPQIYFPKSVKEMDRVIDKIKRGCKINCVNQLIINLETQFIK